MAETCTYRIVVRGRAAECEINAHSPIHLAVLSQDAGATRLAACTDQAGLVGLVRYLHSRGFVLLSVARRPTARPPCEPGC